MQTRTRTLWTPGRYPDAPRSGRVDKYKSEKHGDVDVNDPYEWLEHNSRETELWTNAQVALTRNYLDQNLDRQGLEDDIRNNSNYTKFSAPSLKGDGRWYWYHNSGLQPQSVICRSKDEALPDMTGVRGPGGEIFFDPNVLSNDGTASLAATGFSLCGEYFAYGISDSGSDFYTIYVRRTSEPLVSIDDPQVPHDGGPGRLCDKICFVKFSSPTWTHDSKGFFYQRYPEPKPQGGGMQTDSDRNAMLYYHRIGTSQSEDILVYKDDNNPEWFFGSEVSDVDGRYLMLYISKDTSRRNLLWITDLKENAIGQDMVWDKLIDDYDSSYNYVANDDTKFYFMTNKDAPQYKLVSVDLTKRIFADVIPEDKDANLEDIVPINNDKIAVVYKRNVKDEIYIYNMEGRRLTAVAPDFVGAASIIGRRSHPSFFATLGGFTDPGIIARYDFTQPEEKRWSIYRTTVLNGLKAENFVTDQVWYTSKDGTRVPMFIVRHKNTKVDGTAPVIQYGYGGFSVSVDPFFSASLLTFVQRYGAILAVPSIRGGGEFGDEWHLAGTRERKVNCFDDFIAATQYLVDNKYAAPGKVAINGASNGGLLVAACVNRAPEGLLGAAVAEVGVLDLLKFPKYTIGRAWVSDYGDPSDPHDFDFIYPISPLHNVPTDRILPPTLLCTADHDDRVVPLHSYKHAATLQHLLGHNPHPLLIRIDKKAGHGAGKSTDQRIKEAADKWGFVVQSLGLEVKHDTGAR